MAGAIRCTVDPGGTGDYLTLVAAIADNFGATSKDLVANSEYVVCTLINTGTTADPGAEYGLTLSGWTTSPSYDINLNVPAAYRPPAGAFPETGPYFRIDTQGLMGLRLQSPHVHVYGLWIRVRLPAKWNNYQSGCCLYVTNSTGGFVIEDAVYDIKRLDVSTYPSYGFYGIYFGSASGSPSLYNKFSNIIVRSAQPAAHLCISRGVGIYSAAYAAYNRFYNLTVSDFWNNWYFAGAGKWILKNVLTFGGRSGGIDADYSNDSVTYVEGSYCGYTSGNDPLISDSNPIDLGSNGTAVFSDYTGGDLHLKDTTSPAYAVGENLYYDANLPITDDVDGDARPESGAHSIGADEPAAAPPPPDEWKGQSMDFEDIKNEVRNITGRNDATFDVRIGNAINRAIRQWVREFPWQGNKVVAEITSAGGRELIFPPEVEQVMWLLDATNYTEVAAATQQWDREYPYRYAADYSSYARFWEPAGVVPLFTGFSGYISFRSSEADDDQIRIIGRANFSGVSGPPQLNYYADTTVTLPGVAGTGATCTTLFTHIDAIKIANAPDGVVSIWSGAGPVGLMNKFNLEPRYVRVRLMDIPTTGTKFKYGAYVAPAQLIDNAQPLPPYIREEFVSWLAASEVYFHLRDTEKQQMAWNQAQRILTEEKGKERMFGDSQQQIVPEDYN